MKKITNLKRLLSLILVVAMMATLASPALAAESDSVSFTKVDNSSVTGQLPGREPAAETQEEAPYGENDVVRVSIFLEKAGTIDAGYASLDIANNNAAMAYRENLKLDQDAVVQLIEQATSEKLDVVWNLTLATNLISANVKYSQIEAIEAVPGVRNVVIETQYSPDVVSSGAADPNMATSGAQIGSAAAWAAGYTGAGSRIAIIDTGTDTQHQSFSAAGFEYSLAQLAEKAGMDADAYIASLDLLDAEEIAAVADKLNAPVNAASAYINTKIPYGFNYVDGNYNVRHMSDSQGEHGSHVSGIAAANAYIPNGDGTFTEALQSVFVQGVAPDAQIVTMKVFGASGGAYDSDYMVAIEDAVLLNCDSVNLSLGSGNPGMSRNSNAEYQAILENLVKSGVVVAMSAGNSGSWVESSNTMNLLGTGYLYADDVSMQTDGSPGSFTNSLAVASVENDGATGMYVSVGDTMIVYNEMLVGNTGMPYRNAPLSTLAGEHEFVLIDGFGTPDDWAVVGDALEGKIALCSRGETSFFEKAEAAVEAGAIATIIYNNQAGVINMDLTDYSYTQPCVSITQADGAAVKANATAVTDEAGNTLYYTGTMTVGSEPAPGQFNSDYYTMSSFSSWGVPGSLELKPEITAPGGNINSVFGQIPGDGGPDQYEIMSGTSMASPQVAGMAAVLGQYIRENGLEEKTGLDARTLAQSLLMSTAVPMLDGNTGYYYPVLQQGAGLANVGAATTADSYILMGRDATASFADGKVKAELGDDPSRSGAYSFSFTLNNLTDEEKTYVLSADFFTQDVFLYYANMEGTHVADYMDTFTAPLGAIVTYTVNGQEVSYAGDLEGLDLNGDGVVNTADGQALLDYVTGTVSELANVDKADLDADEVVDSYDAYLFFDRLQGSAVVPANGSVEVTVNVQLTGYMYSFYTGNMAQIAIDELLPNGAYVEGYVYAEGVSSEEGVAGTAHSIPVLGFYGNWSDASMFEKGSYVEYETGEEYRMPYLGNTAVNTYTVTYANEPGVNYYFGGNPMIADDYYMPERNAINGENGDMISKVNFAAIRNAAASKFSVVNETTGETLVEALPGVVNSAYYYVNGGTWQQTSLSLNAKYAPAGVAEGDTLVASLTLAPEYYVDAEGNVNWDALGEGASFSMPMVIDNTAPTLEDVSLSLLNDTLTVTAYDNQYIAAVVLYNKAGTQVIDFAGAKQEIAPEESADYVLNLGNASGSKFMLQVMDYAMNTVTFEIELSGNEEDVVLPDMIAFDLDYNYWTTFTKESTYADLAAYSATNYTYFAGTIVDEYVFAATDAGELHVMPLNDLTDVTVVTNMGAVITDMAYNKADGNIYGVASGYLVTIDKLTGEIEIVGEIGVMTNTLACDENGTFYCNEFGTGAVYSFTLDTIAEPEVLVANIGIRSQYVQTMEIDPNTGMLCWNSYYAQSMFGYTFGFSYYFEIDPATGKYTRYNDLYDELTSLLIPEKSSGGNWDAPTNEVSGIQLSTDSLALLRGGTEVLSANVLPWTATDRTVTWTSADETVAAVDQTGKVTAVGVGTTTITATSNLDPNFSASCTVTVTALDITIHGVLQDEDGDPMFYEWNMAEDATWTGGTAVDTSMTSATIDTINNKAYIMDAVANTWSMHLVDPTTGESELVGANGAGVPLWDMEYSTAFSTAETPLVHGIYYIYYLPAKDPMALDTSAFNLQSYLGQYSGASYLVAITSAGYELTEDNYGELLETDHVMMLDNEGYIWDFWTYPTADGYSALLSYAPTDLASYGLDFPGNGEDMYTSMVVGEDGKLYVSAYTGDYNELYRLTYDDASGTYAAEFIGDFGADVWPAILTSVTKNDGSAADSVAAPKPTMQMDAVTVTAEELATITFEADTSAMVASVDNSAKVAEEAAASSASAAPMSSGNVSVDKDTITVTVTAKDATGTDVDSTNGVATVTYDADSLVLTSIAVAGDYISVNEADGSVTFGYVALDGIAAEDSVATLVFEVKGSNTDVTITHKEVNNEHSGYEEVLTQDSYTETLVEWVGASLTLNGEIGLNFYAKLSDTILADESASVQFVVGDEVLNVPVSEGKYDESDGSYGFMIGLNAKNMGDKVTAQVVNADGNVGQSKTLSIKDYADFAIANTSDEALVSLMKAMLNYGAAAQVEFGYDVENLVNADLSEADKTLPESVDVSAYALSLTGAEEGITVTNASLLLQSEAKIRVYFQLAEGKSVSDYTFVVDGVEVTPVAAGNEYYIEKNNVSARKMDIMYTFEMGGLTLSYSGLSYVRQVQVHCADDVDLMNLAKALYCYNQAANAYFE